MLLIDHVICLTAPLSSDFVMEIVLQKLFLCLYLTGGQEDIHCCLRDV